MIAHVSLPIELLDLAVFAELAVWGPHPALHALCRAAVDGGALDEDAVDRVVPGLSPRGRGNLLRHLCQQRLLRRDGHPTALGRRCAETGEAPTWEQGVYRLLVALHPLVGCELLAFKRAGTTPHDRDFDSLEAVPAGFRIDRHRVFTSVFDPTTHFSLAPLPDDEPLCRRDRLPPATLRWQIDPRSGTNTWQISGDHPRPFESSPGELDPAELDGIIATWDPDWDPDRGRLRMAYDGEPGFTRHLTYSDVRLPRCPQPAEVLIDDVPVGPGTAAEARAWALALALDDLGAAPRYLTPDTRRALWAATLDDTPLTAQAGDAPEIGELAAAPAADARSRWLLRAAEDLEAAS